MKTVATFSTPSEAYLAVSRLGGSGIEAQLRDETAISFYWLLSDAMGGVKVEVADEDWARAREVLELPATEPGLLMCPHCGSSDTKVQPLSSFGAICIAFRLPFPLTETTVNCRSCGTQFEVPTSGKEE